LSWQFFRCSVTAMPGPIEAMYESKMRVTTVRSLEIWELMVP
jgi:hypothetical protein